MKRLNRLRELGREVDERDTPEPAVIVFWPPEGEPGAKEERERLEKEVREHKESGRHVVEFYVEDAS